MGLSMGIQAASDETIESLASNPRSLDEFIKGATFADSANAKALKAILTNAAETGSTMNGLIDMFGWKDMVQRMETDGPSVDIGKVFHGLHYLLTGDATGGREPLCYLQYGGRVIGHYRREWVVRAITSSQVIAFEGALQTIDREELLRRYNPKFMAAADLYPTGMFDGNDGIELHICDKLEELKAFLKKAISIKHGAVICAY